MVKERYGIVDWVYDHVYEEDLKSKDTLSRAIDNLEADTKGTAKAWKDADSDWFSRKYKQTTLSEKVNDKNEDYISKVQAQIESANKETIKDIKIDEDYEESTKEVLGSLLDEKKKELEGKGEGEFREEIGGAATYGELSQVSKAINKSKLPRDTKERLREEWGAKSEEFASEEELLMDELRSATTTAGLERAMDRHSIGITDRSQGVFDSRSEELS